MLTVEFIRFMLLCSGEEELEELRDLICIFILDVEVTHYCLFICQPEVRRSKTAFMTLRNCV